MAEPEGVIPDLCQGLGIEVEPGWLADVISRDGGAGHEQRPDYEGAVSGASVGRWREDLSADEQREVARRCGPRLRELGYDA